MPRPGRVTRRCGQAHRRSALWRSHVFRQRSKRRPLRISPRRRHPQAQCRPVPRRPPVASQAPEAPPAAAPHAPTSATADAPPPPRGDAAPQTDHAPASAGTPDGQNTSERVSDSHTGDETARHFEGPTDGHRQNPVHSHQQSGDGWHRVEDKPIDPNYGQPLGEHWQSADYPTPNDVNRSTFDLVERPDEPYNSYTLTGKLPEGWTIELSGVAPAFGRDGGGLQVVILDDLGNAVPISTMLGKVLK